MSYYGAKAHVNISYANCNYSFSHIKRPSRSDLEGLGIFLRSIFNCPSLPLILLSLAPIFFLSNSRSLLVI